MPQAAGARSPAWLIARPIAHRGLHDRDRGIVENTAGAVTAAIEAGYAIEIDLQVTADGAAVVFHDATLERLTGERGAVRDRTAQALAREPLKHTDDRIMTLGALLGLVAGRAPLFLELKSLWQGPGALEEYVAGVLAGYDGPVAAMSFDPEIVGHLRARAPAITRGVVACRDCDAADGIPLPPERRRALHDPAVLDAAEPHFLAYDVEALPSTATRAFRASGRPVLTWTVRTPAQLARARRHADQIIFEGLRPWPPGAAPLSG